MDIGCRLPFDPLMTSPYSSIFPLTRPMGVSNDLFFSIPQSPFLSQLIHALPSFAHGYGTKYPTVMLSTGPFFVDIQYAFFTENQDTIGLLHDELYGGPKGFVYHVHGSSWHEEDALFILWLGRHFDLILFSIWIVILVLCSIGIAIRWRFCRIGRGWILRKSPTISAENHHTLNNA